MPKKLLVLLLLFIAMATIAATIYKWVDEKGVTHYSATPPDNQKGQKIQISPSATTTEGGKSAPSPLQKGEQGSAESKKENNKIMKPNAGQTEGEERCQEARKQLALLQEQGPVYRDESGKLHLKWKYDTYQGNREYLDDTTRSAEIKHVRQEIETSCPQESNVKDQELARKKFIRSEYCAAARADLEAMERPEARSPQSEIDKQRNQVKWFCTE
jgi:hypothetical protein